jgi:histone H3/H4
MLSVAYKKRFILDVWYNGCHSQRGKMPSRRSKKTCPSTTEDITASVAPEALEVVEPPPASDVDVDAEAVHHRKKRRPTRRSSDLSSAVPSAVFRRLVREITNDIKTDLRWEAEALEALQTDAEAYMVSYFGDANKKRQMCESRTLKRIHFVK